ncbi:MAG TPA: MotA/TolQ/ExbB proton channel family protein [Acidocella sp.]|nr:MotA/TolQ/ExbB proton channel family protein [Acidocella sp.]
MTSILGLFLGVLVVVLGAMADNDPLSSLFSLTALIIVLGGTAAALMVQFRLGGVLSGLKGVVWLARPPKIDLHDFVTQMTDWATISRQQGTLALEPFIAQQSDPLQAKALQMIVDNTPASVLREKLTILAETISGQEQLPGKFWEAAGGFSPTIGVMGAVLGLIHVMMMLNHPELLGAGIATAFIATVYGVGTANLFYLPMGSRLAAIAEEVEQARFILIDGFVMLAQQRPASVIRDELLSIIPDNKKAEAPAGQQDGEDDERQAA